MRPSVSVWRPWLACSLAPLAAALVASGCDVPRPIDAASTHGGACTLCHGGTDNTTGAPPRATTGETATSSPRVGAHTTHVSDGALALAFDCGECHVRPADVGSPGHLDGPVLTWGPMATAGGATPSYQGGSCASTYCHGAFPGGNASNAPRWTEVDGTQAACGTCHGDPTATPAALPRDHHAALAADATHATCSICHPDTVDVSGAIIGEAGKHVDGVVETDPAANHPPGWTGGAGGGLHGMAAAADPGPCIRCHAATGPPHVTTVVCAGCHDALAGGGDWTTTCNTCHGSALNAAPPKDTAGNTDTSAVGVGAHQAHVSGASGLAAPFDCVFCHRKPANVFDAGHLDGAVTVTGYTGSDANWLAVAPDPGFEQATATCATAYCHGAMLEGGTNTRPSWTTVDGTQAACGTCHGFPPASYPSAAHPRYVLASAPCIGCHPASTTVDGSGGSIILPGGGSHVDGLVEFTFAGHPAGWANLSSTDPNCRGGLHSCNPGRPGAMIFYYADPATRCTGCHGDGGDMTADGGPVHVSCGACHPNAFTSRSCVSLGTAAPCSCDLCH